MKRACLFIFSLSLLASAGAVAQVFDFKGIPFGSDETKLQEAIPGLTCAPNDPSWCFARGDLTYAAERVESISFRLIDGKLEGFFVTFKPRSFEMIADALRTKYGKPHESEDSVYQTVGGAKATQTTHTWQLHDGGYARISRYGSSITTGRLSVNSAIAVQRSLEQQKDRAAKAKGDI